MRFRISILGGLFALLFLGAAFIISSSSAQNCPLTPLRPYKSSSSPDIYYVTANCTKQLFPGPSYYLSYFPSFGSVVITSPTKLNAVPFGEQKTTPKNISVPVPAPSCPLAPSLPYKLKNSPDIYYITSDCTKQIFPGPSYYLSYFPSFDSVVITSPAKLNAVPFDKQKSTPKKNRHPVATAVEEAKADKILNFKGLGATHGPDKPIGSYQPTLYQELTLRVSRNETVGFFLHGDVFGCESIQYSSPRGINLNFFNLPQVTTQKRSAPSLYLGAQFDPAVPTQNPRICQDNGGWIFVDLAVSASTAPGTYSIPLKLKNSGQNMKLYVRVYPMTLNINDEAMPSYWIFDEWAAVQQHFGGNWDRMEERQKLHELYLKSMRDHRMSGLNSNLGPLPVIKVSGRDQLDVSKYDYLKNVIENRPQNALIPIPWNRSKSVQEQKDYLIAAENTVVARDWQGRAFIYLTDEPARFDYPHVAQEAKKLKEIAPHIKVMVTTVADPSLIPYVDIFVVLIDQIDADGFPAPETYRKIMKEGKTVWLYISCDSHGCGSSKDTPWPDLMLDDPAVHARSIGWMNDHFGTDGFLYYLANLAYFKGDPFVNQFDFGGNGDGNVFYPGLPGERGLTSHQPIPSLRMKIFRESANDAEYLKLLRSDPNAPTSLKNRVDNLVKSSTDWSKNFQDYQQLRDDIGDYYANKFK